MQKFNVTFTWKHSSKSWNMIDFELLQKLIKHYVKMLDDVPDPKITIEIFREYE